MTAVQETHLEGLHSAHEIRRVDLDDPVKPARPDESRVQHISPVGGTHHDYPHIRAKAVHF